MSGVMGPQNSGRGGVIKVRHSRFRYARHTEGCSVSSSGWDPEMCVDDVNLSLGFVPYTLVSIEGDPRLKLSVVVP